MNSGWDGVFSVRICALDLEVVHSRRRRLVEGPSGSARSQAAQAGDTFFLQRVGRYRNLSGKKELDRSVLHLEKPTGELSGSVVG